MSFDHQKREAKQCLWDNDGSHTPKTVRNRGKGRGKDRRDIRQALAEMSIEAQDALEETWSEEIDEALYCHFHGPCAKCVDTSIEE